MKDAGRLGIVAMTDLVAEIDEEDFGFDVEKPVGAWNKQLEVDYPGVFKALLKATIGYWTGNAPATVSSAIDAAFAFKVTAKPLPPALLAWHLVRRALARAMAKLTLEALRSDRKRPTDSEGMVAALDATLDRTAVRIDRGFLEHPAGAPIVAAVKEPFRTWLREGFGLSDAQTESVARRLGAYFVFALRREWAVDLDDYVSLNAEMRKWDTPFAKASARERSWLRNAAWLQRQIQLPVFDESFSLDQVYVDLYGYYETIGPYEKDGKGEKSDYASNPAPRKTIKVLVDLKKELKSWLESPSQHDTIRVLSGDPGSGKSSFAKILAAELANGEHRRVLFVPLHLLNFTGDIQVALRNFVRNAGILSHDPLNLEEGDEKLIIFFDGLDELALEGHAGRQAAHSFAVQINTLVKTLNLREPRLLVIIAGRELVVQATSFLFQNPRQILRMLPYQISKKDYDEIDIVMKPDDFRQDRRHVWWRKYGRAGGGGRLFDGVPEELNRDDLLPITRQPLLNYLVALSHAREKLDFTKAITLNEIYADLLEAVYERRWGEPESYAPTPRREKAETRFATPQANPGHPTVRALGWDDFIDILEEVALLSWHGTGRTIKASEVMDTCDRLGLTAKLDAFKEGAEQGAVSLLVAFFFRQARELGTEPSFEFTHKSFGEYLTARRLVNEICNISDERSRNRQYRKQGKDIETSLLDWVRLAGPSAIDQDLLTFVTQEIGLKLKRRESVANAHATLIELMNDQLENGLPMTMLRLECHQEMTHQARNAEESLLGAIFACATTLNGEATYGKCVQSEIAWPTEFALRDLLARLVQEQSDVPLANHFLGWITAEGQRLISTDLYGANLQGAQLERADLEGANLQDANLEGASLLGARLYRAYLKEANLYGANLEGVDFEEANLQLALLTDAHLKGANLERAHLEEAVLEGADLEGTNLNRAHLENAHLREADLEGALLEGAHLNGADLQGVNLSSAHLLRALLRKANLSMANLEGANFKGAHLEGANLKGANLEGTNLEEARSLRAAQIDPEWLERLGIDPKRLKDH
jgi:uncharacterized protein YjbI with pentapeptide repeats